MTIGYSAFELLEMAQQMERNGCAFYERAVAVTEGEAAATLQTLAEMERAHEETFAAMAAELRGQERPDTALDPNAEAVQYVRAVVGGHVFELRADPAEWLGTRPTLASVLRTAIDLEKETILYYLGVRDVLTGPDRDRMDEIIREEMGHVVLLTRRLPGERGA
ncbi:MAG: ferritin family protein [Phycisphaerae bacterium]|nr:ferritin family protein [Phycisphaerae bacterium]